MPSLGLINSVKKNTAFKNLEDRESGTVQVLATFLQILSIAALALYGALFLIGFKLHSGIESPIAIALVFLLSTFAKHFSLRRKSLVGALVLITIVGFVALGALVVWGYDLPIALLAIILTGVLSGILLGSSYFLISAGVLVVSYLFVSIFELTNNSAQISSWRLLPRSLEDIVIFTITIAIIFAVIWVFNRQLHLAYIKAKTSEERLQEQSNHLEELVEQRTSQLREEHKIRLSDLHKFITYGKEASGLIHDMINPMTALSIELQSAKQLHKKSPQIDGAQAMLKRLEQLVSGARRHLQNEQTAEAFSVHKEIKSVLDAVQHRAREFKVALVLSGEDCELCADPVSFYKIILNLVCNSLDACEGVVDERRVSIATKTTAKHLTITIQDTGVGIPDYLLPTIFEPFTSNKERGLGLGLSLVQELVTEVFNGSVEFDSKPGKTTCTVKLPR